MSTGRYDGHGSGDRDRNAGSYGGYGTGERSRNPGSYGGRGYGTGERGRSPGSYGASGTLHGWSHEGFLPFRLEVLTPVFIGTGEPVTPFDYVIRKDGRGFSVHLIDTERWFSDAWDNPSVTSVVQSGDLRRIRRLLDEAVDEKIYSLARIPVGQEELARKLIRNIRNPDSRSKVELELFFRNPLSQDPVLPGSSLKGALSTPVIDLLDQRRGRSTGQQGWLRSRVTQKRGYSFRETGRLQSREYSRVLTEMFGQISDHAMNALKVSDLTFPPDHTGLVTAEEVRKEASGRQTPKSPCEVLLPTQSGDSPLYGRLLMKTTHGKPCITFPDRSELTPENLVQITGAFYTERYRKELHDFYTRPHLRHVEERLRSVTERIENRTDEEILLRIGRYSHIECMTVTDNDPKNRRGYGKTRTLADGKLPFGWVILKLCSRKEYLDGTAGQTADDPGTEDR